MKCVVCSSSRSIRVLLCVGVCVRVCVMPKFASKLVGVVAVSATPMSTLTATAAVTSLDDTRRHAAER